MLEKQSIVKPTKAHPQMWMSMSLGKTGVRLCAVVTTWSYETQKGEIRAEVIIDHADSKSIYARFEAQKSEIEQEFGSPLVWQNERNQKSCKIYIRKEVDVENRDDWSNQHEWLKQKLEALYRVFQPRAKALHSSLPVIA